MRDMTRSRQPPLRIARPASTESRPSESAKAATGTSPLPTRAAFRAFVAVMREVGAIEAFGIWLGPVPSKATEPRRKTLAEQEAERGDSTRRALRILKITANDEAIEALRGKLG